MATSFDVVLRNVSQSVCVRRGRAEVGLRRPGRRARAVDRRPGRRAEGLPDLAATLRQVVADWPVAPRARTPAREHAGDHGQQLQLLRGISRGIYAGAGDTGRGAGRAL